MNFNLRDGILRKVIPSRQNLLVMKLLSLFMIIGCLQIHAAGTAQRVSLSFKQAPLESVLKEIKTQTGLLYWCDQQVLKQAKPITVDVKDADLVQALRVCLKDQKLSFSIDDQVLVISPTPPDRSPERDNLSLLAVFPVSGVINDAEGVPVSNVTVAVKGSKNSTSSDGDGKFSLNVNVGDILVFTSVGFEKTEITIKNTSPLTITLSKATSELDEVVVNKGYYSELRKFSTGNVSTITSKDIEKQPVQNPLLTLQGRVPGVEVYQSTGINGGGVTVRIQGINSISSTSLNPLSRNEPLIIVDGIPYPSRFTSNSTIEFMTLGGSPLNYINPSDIESISVLKDADATAIYGSRAANGAILITTKKGKSGKPKLIIDFQQGWGKVTRHVDMMNTRQYLDMRYEALKNDGLLPNPNADYDLTLWDTTRYTDWQKELIGGTAQYTNINSSVSGGTTLVQYLVGASYNRQTTVFPGDFDNKACGLHFSLNGSSPNGRLQMQFSGSYQYNQNELPTEDLTQSAVLLEPNAPLLYNDDGSLNWAINASGSSTWNNPLKRATYAEYSNATKNILSNINVSYSLLPGLVISSNLGYNNLENDLFNGTKLLAYAPEARAAARRSASFGTRTVSSWIIEPKLQLDKNLGKGNLDALVGTTIQKSRGNYLQVVASGQPTDELLHSLASATSITTSFASNTFDYTTRFNGIFGRVGYNWDKKYLINLTGRRDGSSKFGDENKFHNFWSAGAGWIFSEEKFLQWSKSWLSFGKIRASYGTTGNDQISDYSYLSLYNILTTDIQYQGTTSFYVAGLSNPFLQWEETRKLQGGIDLSAFNERIALGVTYARNRSSNQLVSYSLPGITGFNSFIKNFPATVQNTSWEISLNTVNVKSRNLNWTTNINLTIPRNKVTSFPGIELTSYASGLTGVIVGEPIGVQKLYLYGGVNPANGTYMLLDSTGEVVEPSVSSSALKQSAMVSLLPKFYGGISNTISYKGFQLDFLFQFVYGMGAKDMYYSNASFPPGSYSKGLSNQPISVINRWQKSGDNAMVGRFSTNPSFTIWPPRTDEGYSYAAGSYIRLKNVSLSWQLPDTWSKLAHLQSARIYFHGQNLATITGYKGLDPETRSFSTLPPLQMWAVGAKVEL